MEIIKYNYKTPRDWERELHPKRVDNVKIVSHPLYGRVYVCPSPPSHFPDLEAEAKRLRFKKYYLG